MARTSNTGFPYMYRHEPDKHGKGHGGNTELRAFPSYKNPGRTGYGRGRSFAHTPEEAAECLFYIDEVLASKSVEAVIRKNPSRTRSDYEDENDPAEWEGFVSGGWKRRRAHQAALRIRAQATGLFGPGDELAPASKSRKEVIGDICTVWDNGGMNVFTERGVPERANVQSWADRLGVRLIVL